MRRKNEHILNGALIGSCITSVVDIFSQWLEHRERGEKFTWKKYNGWRTIKYATVGGSIGAGIGYGIYRYKISEERKLPFSADEYLKKVLTEEHLKANPAAYNCIIEVRKNIKQRLSEKFGNKLITEPTDTGSFYKRTAIGSNYDLDIILPFRKSSYNTLEEMYYDVYGVIYNEFGSMATVYKQTKAIGLSIDYESNPIHIDIVPGREINNYLIEKDLNLFVKPEWVWQRGSTFKTNVGIQQTITTNKPEARRVIKLLKTYRDRNCLDIPTIVIDQCVVDAMSTNNFGIHTSDTENLLNSMSFIANKIEQKNLIDYANSNNNLNNKINDSTKSYIAGQLKSDIMRIEENPRYIKEIFEC